MAFVLNHLSCACALGRTNDEVLAGLRRAVSPLAPLSGDIPGRSVHFGSVPGALPEIADPRYRFRTCQLLAHAVAEAGGAYEACVARYGASRVAVVLGSSNTGIDEAQRHVDVWLSQGTRPDAFSFSMIELGSPALYLAELLGITGPAYVVSTACSSGVKAFASARRLIASGAVDAAIVGGVDGRCRFALNGFHALGALAEGVCRPLAPDRDGINLGEGVALFALEKERAPACPAAPELCGIGESSDAYHPTAPDPEGTGAEASMRAALADAGLGPGDVAYVNLHGTGTWANDDMEMKALRRVFGETYGAYASTKSLTGHCLGAAGAVEAAICWLKLASGDVTGPALSNSFAFGGSNATLALSPAGWKRQGGR
jgi:3-oxoacyl-[acyl-carrier-protein] synthase-1